MLNFCCFVVILGRVFLRYLIDFISSLISFYYYIRLNREFKYDIRMWLIFLNNFNGRVFFLSDCWEIFFIFELYIDVAVFEGYGVVFGRYWFGGIFSDVWYSFNIIFFEFFFIVLVVYIWGFGMFNRYVLFFIDNVFLVDIINK